MILYTPPPQRFVFLDSIRGIAAFVVLLSHVFECFLFSVIPWLNAISYRLFIFDGQLAVRIFFVLSGMSLTVNLLLLDRENDFMMLLKKMIAQRFFRLTLPIAMTSALIAIMINMGMMTNLSIDNRFSNWWIPLFYGIKDVSLNGWFSFSFYDAIILHGTDRYWLSNSLNPVLWTMPIELIGSMLVFILVFLFRDDKRRFFAYMAMALYFIYFKSFMFHFIMGIVAAEVFVRYRHVFDKPSRRVFLCQFTLFIILLALCSLLRPRGVLSGILSFAIILLCGMSTNIRRFLERQPFIFLGKICFTLYLVHTPIITSFSSTIVRHWGNRTPDGQSDLLIVGVVGFMTVVLSLVSAWILSFGERGLMRLYKRFIV
jgi:peptidoglycan/LPS O-acetylase OafA/YrhL